MDAIAHRGPGGISYEIVEGSYTEDEIAALMVAESAPDWIAANATIIEAPQ
jgi:hypothetical protein